MAISIAYVLLGLSVVLATEVLKCPAAEILKCPAAPLQNSENNGFDGKCWDGSLSYAGCCRDGAVCKTSEHGVACRCNSWPCRGWSVDLSKEPNYQFSKEGQSDSRTIFKYGKDNQCNGVNGALSARINAKSFVKFWEDRGCTGQYEIFQNGGTIPDIRMLGLLQVRGVSGCNFTVPKPKEIIIYQHSFWSEFGSSEKFVINNLDECKFVGEWWKDRVSMIRSTDGSCYRFWENRDCTGQTHCYCGNGDVALRKFSMTDGRNWNNQVAALSMCDYARTK